MAGQSEWDVRARCMQLEFYEVFGDRDWDCYEAEEHIHLLRNIGFSIYGPPDEEPDEATNLATGYSKNKLNHIKKLLAKIEKQNTNPDGKINIGFVYVIVKLSEENPVPIAVLRMPGNESGNRFMDTSADCRVYASWDHYLCNNRLPQCRYCYPRGGAYHGSVDVEFAASPACRLSRRVLAGVDRVGTTVALGATAVSLASLALPVGMPALVGVAVADLVAGAWCMGRGVETLVDRARHQQSMGLSEAESRGAYITVGASLLGAASAGATGLTSFLARRGRALTDAEMMAVNVARVGSLTASSIGIANGVFTMSQKIKSGEEVTALEVFQLTSSILFFTHSVVSFKSACKIVRETEQEVLTSFEVGLRSNRHRKQVENTLHGDAKVVRSIVNVDDVDDFFAGVVQLQKKISDAGTFISSRGLGHVRRAMSTVRDMDVLRVAVQVAHQLGFTRTAHFLSFLDFVSVKIALLLNDMEHRSQLDLDLIVAACTVARVAAEIVEEYKRYSQMASERSTLADGGDTARNEGIPRPSRIVDESEDAMDVVTYHEEQLSGALSIDEALRLAGGFTGREATRYNSAVEFLQETVVLVVVMAPNEEDHLVLISTHEPDGLVHVQAIH